jgi:uncharacterized Zn-binding protein involved in type VI secretion
MPPLVVMGATLQCTMGMTPAKLMVIPTGPPVSGPATLGATVMDNKPMANILPFGMCKSPANPTVATATTAAAGVLTPMPCVPMTTAPWMPGATKVTINGKPALHSGCKCLCNWAGTISVTDPGQTAIDVT